jgi:hypothetical protein
LNPSEPLKTGNLLILNVRKNAQNAESAPLGHAVGTRKNDQPAFSEAEWCAHYLSENPEAATNHVKRMARA